MTVLDALKSLVKYPLNDDLFSVILVSRGLSEATLFSLEISKSTAFIGARADCLKELVASPDLSQGGISISVGERSSILMIANDLYDSIGEATIGESEKSSVSVYYE